MSRVHDPGATTLPRLAVAQSDDDGRELTRLEHGLSDLILAADVAAKACTSRRGRIAAECVHVALAAALVALRKRHAEIDRLAVLDGGKERH